MQPIVLGRVDLQQTYRELLLNSTNFSLETSLAANGTLARLTIRGSGYGHGVGMCQWGAIGRARAGEDFRTILRTYYPGTGVGPAE